MIDFCHILTTRFNVKLGFRDAAVNDEVWLAHRFELFETFCVPTVATQSCRDFRWLVFFDIDLPERFRNRVAVYAARVNLVPCFLDGFDRREVAALINAHTDPAASCLITTRLDNDDALAGTFIEQVQQICHRDMRRQFINFPVGFVYSKGRLYLTQRPTNPFVTFVETERPFKTVWVDGHTRLDRYAPVRDVEAEPLWMQVVHGGNVYNRTINCVRTPVATLGDQFALDPALFQQNENPFWLKIDQAWTQLRSQVRGGLRSVKRALPQKDGSCTEE